MFSRFSQLLGIKPGEAVNGMTLEAGWDRIREEYGHRGYLDAKVEPVADYNEQNHTVFYRTNIVEGRQYKFEKLVLTGMSVTSEKRLRAAWPILQGDLFDKEKYEEMLISCKPTPNRFSWIFRFISGRWAIGSSATKPTAPSTCFSIFSSAIERRRGYSPHLSSSFHLLRYTSNMADTLVRIRETQQDARAPEQKERELLTALANCSSIVVALSGGADSAYLAWPRSKLWANARFPSPPFSQIPA